jgi:hypothetical protein
MILQIWFGGRSPDATKAHSQPLITPRCNYCALTSTRGMPPEDAGHEVPAPCGTRTSTRQRGGSAGLLELQLAYSPRIVELLFPTPAHAIDRIRHLKVN